jgi:hypothetical protein
MMREGKIYVTHGGHCSRILVGKERWPGFRPWQFDERKEDSDEYSKVLVAASVIRPQRQVFTGGFFYDWSRRPWHWIQWSVVRGLGYSFVGGGDGVFVVYDSPPPMRMRPGPNIEREIEAQVPPIIAERHEI